MSNRKKKLQSPWLNCGNCNVLMHERDITQHDNSCPPMRFAKYPYVLNCELHCSLDSFTTKDATALNLPLETLDSLIFLSNAALQLSGISIGSWVVVSAASHTPIVRRAWKGNDRLVLSAALFEKEMIVERDVVATISPLGEDVQTAREVILEGDFDSLETVDTLSCIKQLNSNKIFTVGNKITLSFYAKRKSYTILNIISDSDEKNSNFFKVLPETQWRMLSNREKKNIPTPPKIAGLQNVLEDIDESLNNLGLEGALNVRGILLYGPSGTGKSLLVRTIAEKWAKTVINIGSMGGINSSDVDSIMDRAIRGPPTIITIDDIDALCGKSSTGGENAFALAVLLDRLQNVDASIMVFATTNNVNEVARCLRRPGRFDKEIEIGVPSPNNRLLILDALLGENHFIDRSELKMLADRAHGFVGADLAALVTKAASLSVKEGSKIDENHLKACFPLIRPSAMREIMIQVPNVRWEDVGGQASLKHELRQAVEWPLKYPESFKRLGVSPPRGLLMYGPPGCSKTMIAKALATESGLNFFSVKGPELFSCWVGDSEKAVRDLFARARQAAPAIVFFDELDALAGERGGAQSGGTQVQERVLAQLLTELDGVEALGDVIVVGATNRPDRIDPALLRPGRLDRVVYVPLPDSSTRKEIFTIQFRKIPVASDVDVMELVAKTDNYSGAEVVAICREAAMNALSSDISSKCVSRSHFMEALCTVTSRTSRAAVSLCENYKNHRLL